jgi:hypothetical protein
MPTLELIYGRELTEQELLAEACCAVGEHSVDVEYAVKELMEAQLPEGDDTNMPMTLLALHTLANVVKQLEVATEAIKAMRSGKAAEITP